jgi:hypothetical protein
MILRLQKYIEWIKEKYGSIGEVKTSNKRKDVIIHEYLGIKLDHTRTGCSTHATICNNNYDPTVPSMMERNTTME